MGGGFVYTVVYVHTYVCKYIHVQHKATVLLVVIKVIEWMELLNWMMLLIL